MRFIFGAIASWSGGVEEEQRDSQGEGTCEVRVRAKGHCLVKGVCEVCAVENRGYNISLYYCMSSTQELGSEATGSWRRDAGLACRAGE